MSEIGMKDDKVVKIKSLPQPDGGEGASGRQGLGSNVGAEESCVAKARGNEQKPSQADPNRDESALQDEVLKPSYGEGRKLGARVWKDNGMTPGESLRVPHGTKGSARNPECVAEVSRGRSSVQTSRGRGCARLNEETGTLDEHEGLNGGRAEWSG